MTINSWSVFGVGKVSVGSDISGIFDQDLRMASIYSVFLIIFPDIYTTISVFV